MDNTTFTKIDTELFQRLHWGEMTPPTFTLTNGETVVGQVFGVYRSGATGKLGQALSGIVQVQTSNGIRKLSYEQIETIA